MRQYHRFGCTIEPESLRDAIHRQNLPLEPMTRSSDKPTDPASDTNDPSDG